MIEFTKSYTSQGKAFTTLRDAQINEVHHALLSSNPKLAQSVGQEQMLAISTEVVTQGKIIADILTTTATSKPRARKINGGTRTRAPKAAAAAAPAQPELTPARLP